MNQEKFGVFVQQIRKEKGLTQKELAGKLNLTDKAVSKWERGASLPDIMIMERLAEALDVSVLELLEGERLQEGKVEKQEAEYAVRDIVSQAVLREKKMKRKWLRRCMIAVILLILLLNGKQMSNWVLDCVSSKVENESHTCSLTERYPKSECSNYYIYGEILSDNLYRYHVAGVDAEGESRDLFVIEERGMYLCQSPKLIHRGEKLFVVIGGMDNEDMEIRLYSDEIGADPMECGSVGADPQGFLPYLYCYDLKQSALEKIEIEDRTSSMLVDAFDYNGENIYLTERFRGILGGLHLGFFMGDKTYCSIGADYPNLFGDGGINATGYYDGEDYYIAGQQGIYSIAPGTKEGAYVKELDLSHCYRSEISAARLPEGGMGYVLAAAYVDQVDEFNKPCRMHTEITVYDENWQEKQTISVPIGISALEWGGESVMVSCVSNYDYEGYKSYLVRYTEEKPQELPMEKLLSDTQKDTGFSWEIMVESDPYLDGLERCNRQWVYLEEKTGYCLAGEAQKIFCNENGEVNILEKEN